MDLTRRGWATVGCGLALVVGALVFAVPALLGAAVAVGALLCGAQYAFVRALGTVHDDLALAIEAERQHPTVGEETALTLTARRATASLPLRVTLSLPGAAIGPGPLALVLDDETDAEVTAPVEWAVAGTYRLGPPRVVATDPLGLFVAAFRGEATAELSIRAREATPFLGQGGDRFAGVLGQHRAGDTGMGIEPAELHRYEPGEDIGRIDWNATARLNDVYVVEPEAETDRRTVLILDHRASMGLGTGPDTPLAYLRHAALALTATARRLSDPLGVYAVGDDGVTVAEPPRATPGQYGLVAAAIRDLEPTAGAASPAATPHASSGPSRARRAAARLAGHDDQFATRLSPLLTDTTSYVQRVEAQPLFAVARAYLRRLQGTVWSVIITDDTRREELRETVKLARRGNDHVLVLLAPAVLFEADGLADLDRAASRYRDFESFRRDLAAMDRVDALALAPEGRVQAVRAGGGASR